MLAFLFLACGTALAADSVCACPPADSLVDSFNQHDVAVYARVKSSALDATKTRTVYQMQLLAPIKGCLLPTTEVSIVSPNACRLELTDQPYLVFADWAKGRLKRTQKVWLDANACTSAIPSSEVPRTFAHWMASQTDRCTTPFKGLRCPSGGRPLKCAAAKVCAKAFWCEEASFCKPNGCGLCTPEFFDKTGKRVCTGLPAQQMLVANAGVTQCLTANGSTKAPAVCYRGAKGGCSGAKKMDLKKAGCNAWAKARTCVEDPCALCAPHWLDDFGREVCRGQSDRMMCQRTDVVLFKKKKKCMTKSVGYGLNNKGVCKLVKGCAKPVWQLQLPSTALECNRQCVCPSVEHVDMGSCGVSLGYAMLGTSCSLVMGCADRVGVLGDMLHGSLASCRQKCDQAPATSPPTPPPTTIFVPPTPLPTYPTASPTVQDTIVPSITCPGDGAPIVVEVAPGSSGIELEYDWPQAYDNLPGVKLQLRAGLFPKQRFPMGDTVVTWAVIDAVGLEAECSFTITVSDGSEKTPPPTFPPTLPPTVPPTQAVAPEDLPTITCPGEKVEIREGVEGLLLMSKAPLGATSLPLMYPIPAALDQRPGANVTLTKGIPAGGTFPLGLTLLQYTVLNALGYTASCEFYINVTETKLNQPPVILTIPPQNVLQNVQSQVDLSRFVTDAEGEELVYFVADLPTGSGLTVQYDSGKVVGTPSFEDANAKQPIRVRLMVVDSFGGRALGAFELFVKKDDTNKAPVAFPIPDIETTQGQSLNVSLAQFFSDPEGAPLEYLVAGLPFESGIELLAGGVLGGVANFRDRDAKQPIEFTVIVDSSSENESEDDDFVEFDTECANGWEIKGVETRYSWGNQKLENC